jgi:membrane-associated protease RseP (regulator of RpoE activity)
MRTTLVAVSLMLFAASVHADPKPRPAPAPARPAPAPADTTHSFDFSMTAGPGRLGIAAIKISPELRAHYGAPKDRGVLVDFVRADGVAARAGIQPGDIVIEVDQKPVRAAADVIDAMTDRKKGDTVAIELVRAGARTRLSATLDTDPMDSRAFRFDDRELERWIQKMPRTGSGAGFDRALEQQLDEMRRRLEQLERRSNTKPIETNDRRPS